MNRDLSGIVLRISRDVKTAVVSICSRKMHTKYKKVVIKMRNYLADCTGLSLKVDESVRLREIAPISKRKSWKVLVERK